MCPFPAPPLLELTKWPRTGPRLPSPSKAPRALPAQDGSRVHAHALHRCDVRRAFLSPPTRNERADAVPPSQPNDFLAERYSLRQILYETPRRTELFLVLTMYNVRSLPSRSRKTLTRRAGGRGALHKNHAWRHEECSAPLLPHALKDLGRRWVEEGYVSPPLRSERTASDAPAQKWWSASSRTAEPRSTRARSVSSLRWASTRMESPRTSWLASPSRRISTSTRPRVRSLPRRILERGAQSWRSLYRSGPQVQVGRTWSRPRADLVLLEGEEVRSFLSFPSSS